MTDATIAKVVRYLARLAVSLAITTGIMIAACLVGLMLVEWGGLPPMNVYFNAGLIAGLLASFVEHQRNP